MTKQLNKSAVFFAVCSLCAANGGTTTLEVKEHLRCLGYFATQDEVSKVMDMLANISDQDGPSLSYTVTGSGFRYYSISEILIEDFEKMLNITADEDEIKAPAQVQVPLVTTTREINGAELKKGIRFSTAKELIDNISEIKKYERNPWVVTEASASHGYGEWIVFSSWMSRDDVRNQSYKKLNVKFTETRAFTLSTFIDRVTNGIIK